MLDYYVVVYTALPILVSWPVSLVGELLVQILSRGLRPLRYQYKCAHKLGAAIF